MTKLNITTLINEAKAQENMIISELMTIDQWCYKLNSLMQAEANAAVAIFGYSLPHPANMLGCPLGDEEFEQIGALITCDCNALAAAEKTGLIAEGIDAIFFDALNNCGSWSYHYDNIKYILEHEKLRKYVSFSDRYIAEKLLGSGKELCKKDNLWHCYIKTLREKLRERESRGY